MKKFIHRLIVLLLGSMVFGVSGFAYGPDAFVIEVNASDSAPGTESRFTIPIDNAYTYKYNVDCNNDGTNESENNTDIYTCYYSYADTIETIVITGNFPVIYFKDSSFRDKLLSIKQWGTQIWKSMHSAFYDASNLTITATDNPDLSHVLSMNRMFLGAESLNQDIGDWNVSNVQDMNYTFFNTPSFNQDISSWDVSNVQSMDSMFTGYSNGYGLANLSISNYDNLLITWSKLNLQTDVDFHAGNSKYCTADEARLEIELTYGWNITDDVQDCDFYITTPSNVSIKSGEIYVMSLVTITDVGEYEPTTHYDVATLIHT